MAINKQTLHDGPRNLVVAVNIVGNGGEEASTLLINLSDYNGFGVFWNEVSIWHIQHQLTGFSAALEWDATANVNAAQLVAEVTEPQDYCHIGGRTNNAGAGKTGNILITTTGLGAGDKGDFVLTMRKKAA